MAESFLNGLSGDLFEAESAGLEPRVINPIVIEVMKESGYDISHNSSDSVFEFFKESRLYDYVITVCDEATENRCPIFPGVRRRLRWPFPDPSQVDGSEEEKLGQVRKIRDDIKAKIESWIDEVNKET
jgi:arsenate reductase